MGRHMKNRRPQRSKSTRAVIKAANLIGDGAQSRAYRIAMSSWEPTR